MRDDLPTPGFARRLACLFYEWLLLLAVVFIAGFLFLPASQGTLSPLGRTAFQLYLLGVAGGYFLWFWLHGGQTLPMKTWHIQLISATGGPVTRRQAFIRLAVGLFALTGIGLIWALWDRDRQFLHDRLAGTRLVQLAEKT